MKIRTLFTAAAVLALVSLALVSCFSPWQGDEATLTISVGGGSSRVLVNTQDKEQDSFSYEVIMTGPGGKLNFQFDPGAPLTVKVLPGKWQVEVRAMGPSDFFDDPSLGFPDTILRALGEWEGTVGGNTTANITMTSAMEVSSWDQLEAAVWGDPNGDRKEIILLKGSDWETNITVININRPIELRAVEDVTIYRKSPSVFFNIDTNGALTLKGPLTLNGNKSEYNGYLQETSLINVMGELIMYDGVSLQNNYNNNPGGAVIVSAGGSFTMYGGSISDNEANDGGGVYVGQASFFSVFTMEGGTISRNRAISNGGGVFVHCDDLANGIGAGSFSMNGGTINGNEADGDGGGVYLNYYCPFSFSGGTISDNIAAYNGGGIVVNFYFAMTGGTISGNKAPDSAGGGVYIYDSNGYFNMSGGTISKNEASSGGGVNVFGGIFNMTGGSISVNSARDGGGVYVANGTFTMNGNASVSFNSCYLGAGPMEQSEGGGVYVASNGEFIMYGGSIKNNIMLNNFGSNGGGVYVSGGTFTMNGGLIEDNTIPSNSSAPGSGGGVCVYSTGTFTMTGGSIKNNTISGDWGNGGGVFVSNSEFTMSGNASVSGNTAANGGGVCIGGDGTLTMNGGTISGNTAEMGGGVFVAEDYDMILGSIIGIFRITNGTIYGNETGVSPQSLKNNADDGAALFKYGTAEYGLSFPGSPLLPHTDNENYYTNNTIIVSNGVKNTP